jgi:hypothetical protein
MSVKRSISGPVLSLTVLTFTSMGFLAGAEVRMQPGQWEITEPVHNTYRAEQCFTREQVDQINRGPDFVWANTQAGECSVSDVKVNQNTISYSYSCSKQYPAARIEITYHGTTFEGSVTVKGRVESRIKGRRLSPECR